MSLQLNLRCRSNLPAVRAPLRRYYCLLRRADRPTRGGWWKLRMSAGVEDFVSGDFLDVSRAAGFKG